MAIKILSLGGDQEEEKKSPPQRMQQSQKQQEDESWPDWIKRMAYGTVAQTGKNLSQVPGNILQTAGSLGQYLLGTPENSQVPFPEIARQYSSPEQLQQLDQSVKDIYSGKGININQEPEKYKDAYWLDKLMHGQYERPSDDQSGLTQLGQALTDKLPTEEDVEGFYNQLDTEGYRKPRNETESAVQEIGSDILTLMAPLGPLGKATRAREALKIAGWSNAGKQLGKVFGATEDQQDKIKMGVALMTSLGMTSQIKKKAQELYNYAENLPMEGDKINKAGINKAGEKVRKQFINGPLNPQGKAQLEDALNRIGNAPTMDLNEAWITKQQLSDVIQDIDPKSVAGVHAADIQREFDKALKNSTNKEFSKAYSEANNLYRGVKNATKWTEYVWDTIKGNKALSTVGGLIGGGFAGATGALPLAAKAAAGTGLALAGSRVLFGLQNIATNPSMAKEYIGMMRSAAKLNKKGVIKHATRLEKQLAKAPQPKQEPKREQSKPSGRIRIISLG